MSKAITCSKCKKPDVTEYCLCGYCPDCTKIMHPKRKKEYSDEDVAALRKILRDSDGLPLKDAIGMLS